MKLALAQIKPFVGDIESNIKLHKEYILQSVYQNADLVAFPELSLTGYEPKLAKGLAMSLGDKRLDIFQSLSNRYSITICLGFPEDNSKGVRISSAIFQPNTQRVSYSKRLLHTDELPYFVNGHSQISFEVKGHKVFPAICYESTQAQHLVPMENKQMDVYLAMVAKHQAGFLEAEKYYQHISSKLDVVVAVINSVGKCDDIESCGMSGVWDNQGYKLGTALTNTNDLLVVDLD